MIAIANAKLLLWEMVRTQNELRLLLFEKSLKQAANQTGIASRPPEKGVSLVLTLDLGKVIDGYTAPATILSTMSSLSFSCNHLKCSWV